MKYVLEFGVRGGEHSGQNIISTAILAARMAASLVRIFENSKETSATKTETWVLARNCPRQTWSSSTHFVALSKLDGVPRGSATSALWKIE